MSFSASPLTSRIRQRLPGALPLEHFATETVIVQSAEEQPMRQAIYPDGELDRIKDVHIFSAGLDDELLLATRESVRHTETVAWRLRNICISQGRLCNASSYRALTFRKTTSKPTALTDISDTVAFCSTAGGNDYFAHLLLDDASTAILGREYGRVLLGGSQHPRTQHTLDYLDLFGIEYEDVDDVYLNDVWLFTDHPQNTHRRERLDALRTAVQARRVGNTGTPAYLKRGRSGSARELVNEAELEAVLEKRGFRIVEPEQLTATEICDLLCDTPLVVGVEGSQLVHGVLNLKPNGGLLCIQPAARFNAVYRSFCNSLSLDWGFVVADGSDESFHLPPERLLGAIELMQERSQLSC